MISAELTRKFDPAVFKFNQQGHVYIPVEHFLDRLITVMGPAWGSTTRDSSLQLGPNKTSSGKVQWVSHAAVDVWIRDDESYIVTRTGMGADENFDPNTAMKTALAEAFKKACNQHDIGRYLLGKENPERDIHVQHHEALKSGDIKDIKRALTWAAELDGVEITPGSLAVAYKVKTKDLQEFDGVDAALRSRF